MNQTMYMATRGMLRILDDKAIFTSENQHFEHGCIIQYR